MQKKSVLIDAVVNLRNLEKFEQILPELCCESFSNDDDKLLLKVRPYVLLIFVFLFFFLH